MQGSDRATDKETESATLRQKLLDMQRQLEEERARRVPPTAVPEYHGQELPRVSPSDPSQRTPRTHPGPKTFKSTRHDNSTARAEFVNDLIRGRNASGFVNPTPHYTGRKIDFDHIF